MKKVLTLSLVVICLASMFLPGCFGEETKQLVPPLLPPGFEDSKVPDVPLDSYFYLDQGSPFPLLEDEGVAWVWYPFVSGRVIRALVCLNPTDSSEAFWLKITYGSPQEAQALYQAVAEFEGSWRLCQDGDLFLVYGQGLGAQSLIRVTTKSDFILFKDAYPDIYEMMNRLPTNPPGKAIGAGFVRPSNNFNNWLREITGDEEIAREIIDTLKEAKMEEMVFGAYSEKDSVNWEDLEETAEESGLSAFLVGKSSYPGLVLSQVLPRVGLTEDFIDDEKIYVATFDSTHVAIKSVGSYLYIAVAPKPEEAKYLLRTALAKLGLVSLPPQPFTEEDVEWLGKMIASEAGSVWDVDHWVRCTDEERSAVGWTVLNRFKSGIHGKTIKDVVTERGQYAYNQEPTAEIRQLAKELLKGQIRDPTGGATYFFSPISMPWEGDEDKYISRLKAHFDNFDTGGGLHEVPGISKRVYFPSWTKTHTWVGDLTNVRRAYFMFYCPV